MVTDPTQAPTSTTTPAADETPSSHAPTDPVHTALPPKAPAPSDASGSGSLQELVRTEAAEQEEIITTLSRECPQFLKLFERPITSAAAQEVRGRLFSALETTIIDNFNSLTSLPENLLKPQDGANIGILEHSLINFVSIRLGNCHCDLGRKFTKPNPENLRGILKDLEEVHAFFSRLTQNRTLLTNDQFHSLPGKIICSILHIINHIDFFIDQYLCETNPSPTFDTSDVSEGRAALIQYREALQKFLNIFNVSSRLAIFELLKFVLNEAKPIPPAAEASSRHKPDFFDLYLSLKLLPALLNSYPQFRNDLLTLKWSIAEMPQATSTNENFIMYYIQYVWAEQLEIHLNFLATEPNLHERSPIYQQTKLLVSALMELPHELMPDLLFKTIRLCNKIISERSEVKIFFEYLKKVCLDTLFSNRCQFAEFKSSVLSTSLVRLSHPNREGAFSFPLLPHEFKWYCNTPAISEENPEENKILLILYLCLIRGYLDNLGVMNQNKKKFIVFFLYYHHFLSDLFTAIQNNQGVIQAEIDSLCKLICPIRNVLTELNLLLHDKNDIELEIILHNLSLSSKLGNILLSVATHAKRFAEGGDSTFSSPQAISAIIKKERDRVRLQTRLMDTLKTKLLAPVSTDQDHVSTTASSSIMPTSTRSKGKGKKNSHRARSSASGSQSQDQPLGRVREQDESSEEDDSKEILATYYQQEQAAEALATLAIRVQTWSRIHFASYGDSDIYGDLDTFESLMKPHIHQAKTLEQPRVLCDIYIKAIEYYTWRVAHFPGDYLAFREKHLAVSPKASEPADESAVKWTWKINDFPQLGKKNIEHAIYCVGQIVKFSKLAKALNLCKDPLLTRQNTKLSVLVGKLKSFLDNIPRWKQQFAEDLESRRRQFIQASLEKKSRPDTAHASSSTSTFFDSPKLPETTLLETNYFENNTELNKLTTEFEADLSDLLPAPACEVTPTLT